MIISEPLFKAIKTRVQEADAPLGYLTDIHLKWIKLWACLRFNHTKHIDFFLYFHSTPRRMFVVVRAPNGKMINRIRWMWYRYGLWRTKDEIDMPKHLVLNEWTIQFCRKTPPQDAEKPNDNQPAS